MESVITWTDFFCGYGGSSTGIERAARSFGGTEGQQVMMYGNAVSPPAAELLVARVLAMFA